MAENVQMNGDIVVVDVNANNSSGCNEPDTAKAFAKQYIEEKFVQKIAEKMSTFDQETMDMNIHQSPVTTTVVVETTTTTTPTVNGNATAIQDADNDDHPLNNNVPTVTVTLAEETKNQSESDVENEQAQFVDASDSIIETPATDVTMEETVTEEPVTGVTLEETVQDVPANDVTIEEKLPEAVVADVIVEETIKESPATNVTTEEIVQQYPVTDVTMKESVPEAPATTNVTVEETIPESPATNHHETMEESSPVTSITTSECEKESSLESSPVTNVVMEMTNGHEHPMHDEYSETSKINGNAHHYDVVDGANHSILEAVMKDETPNDSSSNVMEPGQTTMHREHDDDDDGDEIDKNIRKMVINENWWKEKRTALEKEKQESETPVDKFRTIKQNIRRGNTRSLKERFENLSKLTE